MSAQTEGVTKPKAVRWLNQMLTDFGRKVADG
jgi:hypothetical protein